MTANPNGLAAGTYTGTVTITSSTTGESDTVLVTLTVSTLDQAIQLSRRRAIIYGRVRRRSGSNRDCLR